MLKVKLFTRTHKGLELTQSGVLLFQTVSQVFDSLEDAQIQLLKDTREARGVLKVAVSVSLGSFWLAPYLAQFMAQYPEIHLVILAQDQNVDLSKREADVSIRLGTPQQQDLIQRQVAALPLKLYASQAYVEAFGQPLKMADLDRHRVIAYGANDESVGKIYSQWLFPHTEKSKQRKPYFSINSMLGLVQAAEKGLGIVALFSEAAQGRGLVPLLPHEQSPAIDVYYLYPERLRGARKVTAFGDFLMNKVSGKRSLVE